MTYDIICVLLGHFKVFQFTRSVGHFDFEKIRIQDKTYFMQPCDSVPLRSDITPSHYTVPLLIAITQFHYSVPLLSSITQ